MLELVKAARIVPKLVQTALAEAMDAHRNAIDAHNERLEAKSQRLKLIVGKEGDNGGSGKNNEGMEKGDDKLLEEIKEIKNMLAEQDYKISELTANDINRQKKIMWKEVQMTDGVGTVTFVKELWTKVLKKNSKKVIRKITPAVLVKIKVRSISYVDVVKMFREEPTLEKFVKDIMSMRKTEALLATLVCLFFGLIKFSK
jgi:hypothetical protein